MEHNGTLTFKFKGQDHIANELKSKYCAKIARSFTCAPT